MIHNSTFWKDDLLKTAQKLELRLVQTRWGEKNFYTLEKDVFVGLFLIRKLIESKKITDAIARKPYKLQEFPYIGNPKSIRTHMRDSEYDLTSGKIVRLTIYDLCNQFIHSHHFIPFLPAKNRLIGLFFCSDKQRTSGIYLITLFDLVDIYRSVGTNYPTELSVNRRPNGRTKTTIR